jgi:hypothetical protein
MKKILFFAATAAFLAACSSDDLSVQEQPQQVQAEPGAVGFDAYLQKATTRTGAHGDLVNSGSTTDADLWRGFGVFAYYTDNKDYDQLAQPNFMYNQKVYKTAYDATTWTYTPVVYWPNEYGNSAISDDQDRVSFFAYAPYVDVDVKSGKLTAAAIAGKEDEWGITGMNRNTASGDPIIKYIASFKSAQAVDLCWGVNHETAWPLVNGGNQTGLDLGKPWLNVERPSQTQQPVRFTFKHALAKMQVKVNAFVDGTDKTNPLDSKSRIWIRSVKFNGFAMKGALNLNNETPDQPYWMNYNGVGDLESDGEIIVYDGRKDGKEAVQGATATNEKTLGLNNKFIENETSFNESAWAASTGEHKEGVTNSLTSLFQDGEIFYVIPTGDDMEVEIVYDIETIDPNLGVLLADGKTAGSAVENRISKKILFGGKDSKLEAGKSYQINLHLGMNSVEFDANVVGWEDVAPVDVDLPANVPFFTAPNASATATIPYDATTFQIGIKGLNGGEIIKVDLGTMTSANSSASGTVATAPAWTNTPGNANTSGFKVETLEDVTLNPNTSNRSRVITWTGQTSGKAVVVTFTQLASPLALLAPSDLTTKNGFKLRRSTGLTDYGYFCTGLAGGCINMDDVTNGAADDDPKIEVWRNGAKLTWVKESGTPAAGQFEFTNNGTLTFGEPAVKDDVIKVTLKTGDAPAETITWIVAE